MDKMKRMEMNDELGRTIVYLSVQASGGRHAVMILAQAQHKSKHEVR
jgi:hypothetical protein